MVKKEVKSIDGDDYVKWFSELNNKDIRIAGGKGASLAEMYNHRFPIPPGFVVTAQAYAYFIQSTGLDAKIAARLKSIDIENTSELSRASADIRALIESTSLPGDLEGDIVEAYDILHAEKTSSTGALDILKKPREVLFVAVRSSATAEDLVDASFAGQQDSFLGVYGHELLIQKVKECFSSLFTARAIYYRQKKGFSHSSTYLAVVVQKMINSVKSGVMFSKNPLRDDNRVVIEAVWGLGEGIVSGKILPDHYELDKELELKDISVADKKIELVRGQRAEVETHTLSKDKATLQVLSGHELKRLAQYALELEEHYHKPQDIEFAIDESGIYIVQSRPITTKARTNVHEIKGDVLLSGLGASPGVSSGKVIIVHSLDELARVKKGDILVTTMTNPDMVVTMQRAAGIITDEGGVTSHAAIVSREMGIPAVVGTRTATQTLREGDVVTVDGFTGRVLKGAAEQRSIEIKHIIPTKTKIKVIVDLPDYAERAALSGSRGVGLVRLEGIIASSGNHPLWYVHQKKLKEYITTLSKGLKKIALPFDEIWVRTSDIRSDEYRHLTGAPPVMEGNPMLGNHGIRFSVKHPELLEAELLALKEVADEFPSKVFGIMTPQVISVSEVKAVKAAASHAHLPDNVKVGIMVETPAAVQVIEDICAEGIQFISFGTNDLTQFTLAIDRNNPDIQDLYTEMHPAILNSIRHVIQVCKKHGVETSICGQAGSKPEMAAFLLGLGIDSISANADAAYQVSELLAKLEQEQGVTPAQQNHRVQPQSMNIPSRTRAYVPGEEEGAVLDALGDDYNPGLGGTSSEVPALNDAIPSELLKQGKDEETDAF